MFFILMLLCLSFASSMPSLTSYNVDSQVTWFYSKTIVTLGIQNDNPFPTTFITPIQIPKTSFFSKLEVLGRKDVSNLTFTPLNLSTKVSENTVYSNSLDSSLQQTNVMDWVPVSNKLYLLSAYVPGSSNITLAVTYEDAQIQTNGQIFLSYSIPPTLLYDDPALRYMNIAVNLPDRKATNVTGYEARYGTRLPTLALTPSTGRIVFVPAFESASLYLRENGGVVILFVSFSDNTQDTVSAKCTSDGSFLFSFLPKRYQPYFKNQATKLQPLNRRIVLAIDNSISMNDDSRFTYATTAASNMLLSLTDNDQFTFMAFGGDSPVFKWSPVLIPASTVNIASARSYLNSKMRVVSHGTDIFRIISEALNVLNSTALPNTESYIIFFSDGIATDGTVTNPDDMLLGLTNLNTRRTAIHTICIGPGADYDFMERLAYNNGGTFRAVDIGWSLLSFINAAVYDVSRPVLQNFSIGVFNATTTNTSSSITPNAYTLRRIARNTMEQESVLFDGLNLAIVGNIVNVSKGSVVYIVLRTANQSWEVKTFCNDTSLVTTRTIQVIQTKRKLEDAGLPHSMVIDINDTVRAQQSALENFLVTPYTAMTLTWVGNFSSSGNGTISNVTYNTTVSELEFSVEDDDPFTSPTVFSPRIGYISSTMSVNINWIGMFFFVCVMCFHG
eukprot:PhF_6_TR16918/c0_g1_i1/m.25413